MSSSTYKIASHRFEQLIIGHAQLEQLWTGGRWLEGPAYLRDAGILVFSDIPNNRMLRWSEGLDGSGSVTIFRQPSNNANGNTVDTDGRLVTCEHGSRRVTRTEKDGAITVLASDIGGKRFNSPNDVVVKTDGTVWFTDPDYGIKSDYEGDRAARELDGCRLYRLTPGGAVERASDLFEQPNGLAFSPDESALYVSDTGRTKKADGPPHIRRFTVGADNTLSGGEQFAVIDPPASDGFRLDERGNIWTSAGDGVHCLSPDGELLGKIPIPEKVSNVCFGGPKLNRLYITATTSLYSIFLAVRGCR
jgi:gluconolactonase